MICQLCNKEISAVGMAQHLKGNHNGYTNKKYYDEFLLKENENKCIKCGNITDFISITKGYKNKCNKCINHFSVKPYKKSIKTCVICGYESKVLLPHIQKTHNLTEKEYYDKYLKKENEGICLVCNKPTVFLGLNKGYRAHCSVTCSSLDPNVQIKNANTNLKLHGYTQPLAQPEIYMKGIEKSKSPESKQKRQDTCNRLYGALHNWSSPILKEQMTKNIYEKWGVDHISKVPELQPGAHENQRKNHNGKLAWNTPEQRDAAWKTRYKNKNIDNRLDENNL